MDRVLAELRAAWPTTEWAEPQIHLHLDGLDPAALAGPHRADIQWAWACLANDPSALAALQSGPIAAARVHLASLGLDASAIDDALQRALTRLLTDRAALASYRGRGPLASFVRTIAVRFAIEVQRRQRPTTNIVDSLVAPSADPELEYMRRLYADHLATAIRTAWTRLGAHERFLLAMQIHEGMTIDDLARIYTIHRATAARRAAAARAALLAHTRESLREQLAVTDDTVDSILRIVTTSVRLPLLVDPVGPSESDPLHFGPV